MSEETTTPRLTSPRLCPHCGLLVGGDATSCQCGYVFAPAQVGGTASARVREAVDLFSAREALAIALQAVSELRGNIVRWMAIVGLLQLVPMALVGPAPKTGKEFGLFLGAALLSSWVSYGLARTALSSIRGEGLDFRRALVSPAIFIAILITAIVATVPVVIGLLLFLAPGVYLLLMWSQIGFLILDRRARNVDALRASEAMTRDRRVEIFMALVVPVLLQVPAQLLEAAVPSGGSVWSPGFVLFLVSTVWQMMVITYGTFVGAVVYQMLLNRPKEPSA